MDNEIDDLKSRCSKTIEAFKKELSRMRSGRATKGLLEGITVEYYGASVPLNQLGNISVPEPRLIQIQVFDQNSVRAIEKAIMQADLGLNPSSEGTTIRIVVPPLTEERRKELIKKLREMAEERRISVRRSRRDILDHLKKKQKNKEITEDDLRHWQDEVQKVTDEYIGIIDDLLAEKEKEMLEV
ncbi:MAG: ribosome recycling factor [Candidatus Dadabacteria bacterium]|nr:MAG: ribosome recycling factor [Candidatus Dadabacteria bacterium]